MIDIREVQNEITRLRKHTIVERRALERLRFTDTAGNAVETFDNGRGGYVWHGLRSISFAEGEYDVPAEWSAHPVYLRFGMFNDGPPLPEGMLYLDGKLYHGLDRFHGEARLDGELSRGKHQLRAKFWDWEDRTLLGIEAAEIIAVDAEIESLAYDFERAIERLRENMVTDVTGWMRALEAAVACIPGDGRPGTDQVRAAAQCLRDGIYTGGQDSGPLVTCVGHSHIDIIWLWPLSTTRDKCLHTFATVLRYMQEYPEYYFTQSQPQLYDYVKADDPELYRAIVDRAREGRWEAEGALWVEPDMNIPSGESLIRQLVFGKRFYREEFGIDSKVAWLPDVFGYTAALPQILAGAGVPYFVTSKLSWNQTNRYPHDTFKWRGIDGTEVLAYFVTTPNFDTVFATSYAGFLTAKELRETWGRYREKALNDETILPFGHGDGGGGPTREMLEAQRRYAAMPETVRCTTGKVLPFLERLEKNAKGKSELVTWDGELYFELHRGTFTTQAWIKKANRRAEIRLYEAELLASMAYLNGEPYPREDMDRAWKLVLLNQFHDVLPGSSIGQVYDEARLDYEAVETITEHIIADGLTHLTAHSSGDIALFNPLPWERTCYISLPGNGNQLVATRDSVQTASPAQSLENETLFAVTCPPLGLATFDLRASDNAGTESLTDTDDCTRTAACTVAEDGRRLENRFVILELDSNGAITRCYDKLRQREAFTGLANHIAAYEDKPLAPNNDAWDIDLNHENRPLPFSSEGAIRVVESGPLRATIEVKRSLHASQWTQRISIYRDNPRIDFATEVDWFERHVVLKAEFPVNVRAMSATYEIQCGALERPTHRNTSWDENRFEVPAHRWADLSEHGFGVSLLNDCKYGYSAHGSRLALTLLKSATMPDPEADQGHHEFTYSILVHGGDWREATVRQAAELNVAPLMHVLEKSPASKAAGPAAGSTPKVPFLQIAGDAFQLTAVKKADDAEALIIRGYEAHGGRQTVRIRCAKPLARVRECDLLERPGDEVTIADGAFEFELTPYQIRTFLLEIAAS